MKLKKLRKNKNKIPGVGVGDIIEKIIDSRYIGIFTTYRQVIVIEKNRFGNYRKIIVIENVHLISSDKHCSKNKSERVFHILNEYEFVLENSAKSWAAILAEHLVL